MMILSVNSDMSVCVYFCNLSVSVIYIEICVYLENLMNICFGKEKKIYFW